MENSKNRFDLTKTGADFPGYQRFNAAEAPQMFEKMLTAFQLKNTDEDYLDANKVRRTGQFLSVIDESDFILSKSFRESVGITPVDVLVFFLNFNEVCKFKVSDMDAFFDDIYHPGANDIMISDPDFTGMLYVDHDCHLYAFTPK